MVGTAVVFTLRIQYFLIVKTIMTWDQSMVALRKVTVAEPLASRYSL